MNGKRLAGVGVSALALAVGIGGPAFAVDAPGGTAQVSAAQDQTVTITETKEISNEGEGFIISCPAGDADSVWLTAGETISGAENLKDPTAVEYLHTGRSHIGGTTQLVYLLTKDNGDCVTITIALTCRRVAL